MALRAELEDFRIRKRLEDAVSDEDKGTRVRKRRDLTEHRGAPKREGRIGEGSASASRGSSDGAPQPGPSVGGSSRILRSHKGKGGARGRD